MKQKAVFFDIDGTIYNFKVGVQDSTRRAIEKLRENGHLAFVCTGRSRAYISPEIVDIGFDGILAACGTYTYYHDRELLNYEIPVDIVDATIEVLRKYGAFPVLEGRDYLYFDKDIYPPEKSKGNLFEDYFIKRNRPVTGSEGTYRINKATIFCKTEEMWENVKRDLAPYYDFIRHELVYMELIPKGYSKGTGIIDICKRLGIEKEDTFAFGDSSNDLEMFKAAGTAVCMGNGSDDAKAAADYVTDHMEEEGLPNALKHFHLI
ncbi:MAG: Cof-type HAD-IIB family hydrolase [Lachnospiraceae bacterium]|nr:Cof-type HAD-IIB family hydrolase [Lachnospiraceae bacterium]